MHGEKPSYLLSKWMIVLEKISCVVTTGSGCSFSYKENDIGETGLIGAYLEETKEKRGAGGCLWIIQIVKENLKY